MATISQWVYFSWDLGKLPAQAPTLEKGYHVTLATADDEEMLEACFSRSYSNEQGWSTDSKGRMNLIHELLNEALPGGDIDFITIRHGSRIIAASGLQDEVGAANHLPTGVCVLNEYRCRGLGGFLLYESLRQLKEKGVLIAKAQTRKGVTAERYLYSKFGGVREPGPVVVA